MRKRAELDRLLERARNHFPSPEEIDEHRRSFAYGNAALANPDVTRAMVNRAAEKLRTA